MSILRPSRLALRLLATTTLAVGARSSPTAATPPSEMRFSQTIGPTERPTLGLDHLTADQMAVLDALIRRDTTRQSRLPAAPPAATTFSQRLNADELRLSGLATLPPSTVEHLDTAIARRQAALLAPALLAPPVDLAHAGRIETRAQPTERTLHGTFSLSYGWGRGGYAEKTGALTVTMEDPDQRYAVSVGYAETSVKGRDCVRRLDLPPAAPAPE